MYISSDVITPGLMLETPMATPRWWWRLPTTFFGPRVLPADTGRTVRASSPKSSPDHGEGGIDVAGWLAAGRPAGPPGWEGARR